MKPQKTKIFILYARCSTELQSPEAQLLTLREFASNGQHANILEIVDQGYSGGSDQRPGLEKLLGLVRRKSVDTVCVVRLDRMFRSLKHLLDLMTVFQEHNVKFISIEDSIDFSTSIGKLQFQLLGAFAEFERSLIRERTVAGIALAKSKGKQLGRPRIDKEKEILLLRERGLSYRQIERQLGISNTVIKRAIQDAVKSGSESDKNMDVKTRG